MIKVICIDAHGKSLHGYDTTLKEGVVYTASQSIAYDDCYSLAEIPFNEVGWPVSFIKRRFIPISEIDEKEFERNYNKELI